MYVQVHYTADCGRRRALVPASIKPPAIRSSNFRAVRCAHLPVARLRPVLCLDLPPALNSGGMLGEPPMLRVVEPKLSCLDGFLCSCLDGFLCQAVASAELLHEFGSSFDTFNRQKQHLRRYAEALLRELIN